MFLSRSFFAAFLTALIGIAMFSKYPGVFVAAGSGVMRAFETTDERVSPTAVSNRYSVTIREERAGEQLPPLPDTAKLTIENIEAAVPATRPGKVSLRGMNGLPGLREFIKKDGRIQRLRLSQKEIDPLAIVIEQGHYDFRMLREEIENIAPQGDYIRKNGNKYLIRVPILVGEGASLVLSGKDAGAYLLSKERTVFIANAGDLYVLRAKIEGWSEAARRPSLFEDRLSFRPFLVSWSGARMYIAGSELANLGYRKGKSYGVTYSSCEPCTAVRPGLPRPTGAIVGSTFTGLYYGFYSYEADDVAIVGNTYANNIIYGIDPHDRSRRLIIANNEVYGSGKKHGIIISRNVDNSWIFSNYTHDNHGSGIMIDRASRNNVIANNASIRNQGDGITFFESPDNVLYNNKVHANAISGIRVRNSWNLRFTGDQVADNGRVPVVVYSMSLAEAQKDRDLAADPYEVRAGADFVNTVFKIGGGKSAFKIDGVERLMLSGVHVIAADAVFAGKLFDDESDIRQNMTTGNRQVIVQAKAPVQLSQAHP